MYTARLTEPNLWDPLLQQTVAAVLAARMAMTVIQDKKLALAMQNQAINIAKSTIADARIANGNEGGPQSVDRTADWISARGIGGYWNNWNGAGMLWNSWGQVAFPDGSVF